MPHKNLSGFIEQPVNYLTRVGKNFPLIQYPGDAPTILLRTQEAGRTRLTNKYKMNLPLYLTAQRTELIIQTMIENAIDTAYLGDIHIDKHSFGNRKCKDIFNCLFKTYGKVND